MQRSSSFAFILALIFVSLVHAQVIWTDLCDLPPFVDPLPIPPVIAPVSEVNGIKNYRVSMVAANHSFHSALGKTTLFTYNGVFPGPTFVTFQGQAIQVEWANNLPTTHILPIDPFLVPDGNLAVRTVVHLHGGDVPSNVDGRPNFTFLPGQSQTFFYPLTQGSGNLIYHDHAVGITRLNVFAGLLGGWLQRDNIESSLDLPRGEFELPLVIADRYFQGTPQTCSAPLYPGYTYPLTAIEFFGPHITVNSKVWPKFEVVKRKYRFRIYNGAQSRFFNLFFNEAISFVQIGAEIGLFETPVTLTQLLLATGERADVIVDFTNVAPGTYILRNNAPFPYPGGDLPDPNLDGQVMQFIVKPGFVQDLSKIPTKIPGFIKLKPENAQAPTVQLNIREVPFGNPAAFKQTKLLFNNQSYSDRTNIPTVTQGSTKIWEIINLSPDSHPVHWHLVPHQIVNRQQINTTRYDLTGSLSQSLIGAPEAPAANENGWKDTTICPPSYVTRVIFKYATRNTNEYVVHCHMLDHEDNDLMRPFIVLPAPLKLIAVPAVIQSFCSIPLIWMNFLDELCVANKFNGIASIRDQDISQARSLLLGVGQRYAFVGGRNEEFASTNLLFDRTATSPQTAFVPFTCQSVTYVFCR